MFEQFECDCIYVEISNERVPRSGRVEYRARLCRLCEARGELRRADGGMAFGAEAPRYQRMH